MSLVRKTSRKMLGYLVFAPCALLSDAMAQSSELVGDFDCDGKADQAVVSTTTSTLDVSLGSGDELTGVPLGADGSQVFSHDFDGDGCSDLFSYSAGGLESVTLQNKEVKLIDVQGVLCNKKLKREDGTGGFVNNPDNSKGKLKAVLPKQYGRSLKALRLAKNGKILETLPFVNGNEWGDRRRFYTKNSPKSYGKNIVWVLDLKNGTRECIHIPKPNQRYD